MAFSTLALGHLLTTMAADRARRGPGECTR